MDIIKSVLGIAGERPITTTHDGKIWVDFKVHVKGLGDNKVMQDQTVVSFPGMIVDGFEICHTIPNGNFQYMGHIENIGDTDWKTHGHFLGTKGSRLEGIAILLVGKAADLYDVKYFVQMRGIDQSPVVQNGEYAGTRGQSRQVEGISVWLEPRQPGQPPAKAPGGITANYYVPYASYNYQSPAATNGEPIPGGHAYNHQAQTPSAPMVDDGSHNEIDAQYRQRCSVPSDIWEHLPTLYKYSLGCSTIAEFGVRSVVSTWAFLKGLKDTDAPHKKLICCDLEKSPNIYAAEAAAKNNNIGFEFIAGNDLNVDLKDGVDLLFIDTWHIYPQLIRELNMHAPKVRKYIAMHDTTVDGEVGESVRCGMNIKQQAKESGFSEADIRTGLGKAVREFLETHSDWRSKEVFTNCNGLTILERVSATPF